LASQGAAQVAHGPTTVHHDRPAGVVHVIHQEDAGFDVRDQPVDIGQIQVLLGTGERLQPGHDALAVVVAGQAPDEPRPGIGKPFVVQVAGVLGRQHESQAKSTRLLEQPQQRVFGRRILGIRREVGYGGK